MAKREKRLAQEQAIKEAQQVREGCGGHARTVVGAGSVGWVVAAWGGHASEERSSKPTMAVWLRCGASTT